MSKKSNNKIVTKRIQKQNNVPEYVSDVQVDKQTVDENGNVKETAVDVVLSSDKKISMDVEVPETLEEDIGAVYPDVPLVEGSVVEEPTLQDQVDIPFSKEDDKDKDKKPIIPHPHKPVEEKVDEGVSNALKTDIKENKDTKQPTVYEPKWYVRFPSRTIEKLNYDKIAKRGSKMNIILRRILDDKIWFIGPLESEEEADSKWRLGLSLGIVGDIIKISNKSEQDKFEKNGII